MKKITRRHFARFLSHGAIAAAFMRTMIAERAFGIVPGKNFVVFTHPNGHKSWTHTSQAVAQTPMGTRALIAQGMSYNSDGISHGGGVNLLRFNKGQGGSFDVDLKKAANVNALKVAIDFQPNQNGDLVCRDENGQLAQVDDNPQMAFDRVFGGSAIPITPGQQGLIYAGRKSIIDHCLEDVRSLKSELGSMGSVFDDHLAAVMDVQKEIVRLAETEAQAGAGAGPAPAPSPSCNQPALNFPTGPSTANYNAYFDVMSEIIYQGIVCNRLQVAIMQMSNAQSDMPFNFPGSPVQTNSGFHGGLVHGEGRGENYQQIIAWYIQKVASFAGKLAATPGDVLKDSSVLHISEMGIADHARTDIPFIAYGELGGTVRTGRTIQGNASVSQFLKSVSDSMFGPVAGAGVSPMGGLV